MRLNLSSILLLPTPASNRHPSEILSALPIKLIGIHLLALFIVYYFYPDNKASWFNNPLLVYRALQFT